VSLEGIWAGTPRDVWVVGSGGKALHFDGAAWSEEPTGFAGDLHAVFAGCCGQDHATWAVGDEGAWLVNWTPHPSGTSETLRGFWGEGNHNYAVGSSGTIVQEYIANWETKPSWTTSTLRGVWAARQFEDIYAVGDSGAILRYDGTRWIPTGSGTTLSLRGIWGTSDRVYVVGEQGTILCGYRGATVSVTPASPTLTGLGNTAQLAATARDASGGLVYGVTYFWRSDNLSVATVDATGKVTALAAGSVTISAMAPGGSTGSTTMLVSP
jgi:hypothetical protein